MMVTSGAHPVKSKAPKGSNGNNTYRDGNLDPIRGYPARSDPNGPDFTQPDKE